MPEVPSTPAYLQQVARGYRFLDRFKKAMTFNFKDDPNGFNDLEDNLWAFFQNCWHIKDWIRHDPEISQEVKDSIWEDVKGSKTIQIVADMANGSKHFATDPKLEWTGVAEAPTQVIRNQDGTSTFRHYLQVPDGSQITALDMAEQAMRAWQEILKKHDLNYYIDPGTA